jgi:hypothetical protein
MKKNTRVTWTLKAGATGTGTTIIDEVDGKVLVAVETLTSDDGTTTTSCELCYTIWANVTWLSVVTS